MNRPAVPEAAARVADYYQQRGQSGSVLKQQTATVLGGFATVESIAFGFRLGLRFFSLMMLTLGATVALLLWPPARSLHRRPEVVIPDHHLSSIPDLLPLRWFVGTQVWIANAHVESLRDTVPARW